MVALITLVALVGIPLVLVTHRDFATVQAGSAVQISNTSVRLAVSPVSGTGQRDVKVTGLGFPANANIQVTASAPGVGPGEGLGQSKANERGAFEVSGRLPPDLVARCGGGPQACQFEGHSGIVLITAATSDGTAQGMAAYEIRH
ncbi:MAG TPA: hypothetical protein VF157_09680 [Chloroflexota bacterium]